MARFNNANLSYFVGVKADYNQPESILAGDRNIARQSYNQPTLEQFDPDSRLHWTRELHHYKGDVLFSDGHVEEWNQLRLVANAHGRNVHNVFALPTIKLIILPSVNINNYGLPARVSGSAGDNGGDQSGALSSPPANAESSTPQSARSGVPGGRAAAPAQTVTTLPLPTPDAAGQAASQDNPSRANPANDQPALVGTSGGFLSFTQSGCWFWLFLLLLLLILGETWRRLARKKTARNEPEETDPADS
jgi:hypothetical protein